jgi:alpha-methylacyl-CoA racemase
MVDGSALLMTMTYTLRAAGIWNDQRGTNLLDTGAHFYEVYETSDGGFIGVGAIEPQFYAELIRLLGLEGEELPGQMDRNAWPAMKERFAQIFATRTRSEWEAIFDGSDACAAPVLSPAEAPNHPHNRFRKTFTEVAGVVQPAPAPRFGATPSVIRRPPPNPGQHGDEALADWGVKAGEISDLRESGAIC